MEELQVINHNNVDVIDSREVAEMIGKDHRHLIRDIRGYTEILKNTTEPNFGLSDFFIESNYKDSTGRTLPCYLLTRKGCDFIASRMTGKKGVQFSARYVWTSSRVSARILGRWPWPLRNCRSCPAETPPPAHRRLPAHLSDSCSPRIRPRLTESQEWRRKPPRMGISDLPNKRLS